MIAADLASLREGHHRDILAEIGQELRLETAAHNRADTVVVVAAADSAVVDNHQVVVVDTEELRTVSKATLQVEVHCAGKEMLLGEDHFAGPDNHRTERIADGTEALRVFGVHRAVAHEERHPSCSDPGDQSPPQLIQLLAGVRLAARVAEEEAILHCFLSNNHRG